MKGSGDCLNETANIMNAIQIYGEYIYLQVNVLLLSAKWREEGEKLTLIFTKRNIMFPIQVIYNRRVILPDLTPMTGKWTQSQW